MSDTKFNPFGQEVVETLASAAPMVTPQELLEVVTEEVEKYLPSSLKGENKAKTAARQKVLSFMTSLEYKSKGELHRHIGRALKMKQCGRWKEAETCVSAEKIEEMREARDLDSCRSHTEDIDMVVDIGGRTALMLEAEVGDLEEVKKLHGLGARTDLKDNWGNTAERRAWLLGHTEVAEWLRDNPQRGQDRAK